MRGVLLAALGCTSLLFVVAFNATNTYLEKQSQRLHMPLQLHVTVEPDASVESMQHRDDLTIGKSCREITSWFGFFRRWHCQDCGLERSTNNKRTCRKLRRKGQCYRLRRKPWDHPPRYQSQFDPTNNQAVGLRTLNTVTMTKTYYSQPDCTVASCFDFSKCRSDILTVFVNVTGPHRLLDYAVEHAPRNVNATIPIQRVERFEDACLVIVTRNMYESPDAMKSARHWNSGRNNFLWDLTHWKYTDRLNLNQDEPFTLFHVGYAAVAAFSLSEAYVRPGYDMALTFQQKWGRDVPQHHVDIHRPRKWLLSFRGRIRDFYGDLPGNAFVNSPYYTHRWMAAEYWEDAPDIFLDIRCVEDKLLPLRHDVDYNHASSIYSDLLWNTTFGFAPGGNSVGSFRLSEILSTGGIPVVTQDFVAPLAPEIDWEGCVVRISEARIVDLPRILRQFTVDQIRQRQETCWHLYHVILGDTQSTKDKLYRTDERVTFQKAMEIWATRMSTALEMRDIAQSSQA